MGDSPVIGGGAFADDETCAVSATGHGEIFIRWTASAEIAACMRHADETLDEAAHHVVMHDLAEHNGSGGVVAVGKDGRIAMPFNCEGMYRAWVCSGAEQQAAIY